VLNTLAALAASLELGIDHDLAVEIVARSKPTSMRFEPVPLGNGITLIDDAYNANPGSVLAALGELAALVPQERRVAVLGPMRELGPSSRRFHRVIGYRAACSLDRLIVVGEEEGDAYLEGARSARRRRASLHHVIGPDEAARLVQELVRDGDAILVKASRSVGLDRVCALLRQELMKGADPMNRLLAAS
jgi:UDP-N-acetylmuramoyl-tripeptide--D-alanyl-D-alanine ligase